MRVGLVSPYSWTVPGGVNHHVEHLAEELDARGHESWIIAPVGALTPARRHVDSRRQRLTERFIPMGNALPVPSQRVDGLRQLLAADPRAHGPRRPLRPLRRPARARAVHACRGHGGGADGGVARWWARSTPPSTPRRSTTTDGLAAAAVMRAARRAHRGERGGAVVPAEPVPGVVPHHPQRRAGGEVRPGDRRHQGAGAHPLRRPGRAAQGPRRAAAGVHAAAQACAARHAGRGRRHPSPGAGDRAQRHPHAT